MGVTVGDDTIYSLLFADDQLLMAEDYEDLEYMARKFKEEYEKWGLKINELCSFSKLSVTSSTSQLILILQAFRHFTYVTAHSPTLPSLYLRHNS